MQEWKLVWWTLAQRAEDIEEKGQSQEEDEEISRRYDMWKMEL